MLEEDTQPWLLASTHGWWHMCVDVWHAPLLVHIPYCVKLDLQWVKLKDIQITNIKLLNPRVAFPLCTSDAGRHTVAGWFGSRQTQMPCVN